MMNTVIAIICNLIVALILIGGVLSTLRAGIRVSGLRLLFTLIACVGAFFLTPAISSPILGLTVQAATEEIPAILLSDILIDKVGMSLTLINSIIYLIVFIIFYFIGSLVCKVCKHTFIKGIREKSVNKARIRRAKSINPKAERVARRSEFKQMRLEYRASLKWWRRLISCFLGAISAFMVGFVVLIPVGQVFKFMNRNGDKSYLEEGYKYTINGIIEDKVDFDFDGWLVHGDMEVKEPEVKDPEEDVKDPEEETPVECVHEWGEDGKCTKCGVEKPTEVTPDLDSGNEEGSTEE